MTCVLHLFWHGWPFCGLLPHLRARWYAHEDQVGGSISPEHVTWHRMGTVVLYSFNAYKLNRANEEFPQSNRPPDDFQMTLAPANANQ